MNPSPRDMVHQGKINLLASVETVSTQQFPSKVVLTYAKLNIAHKFSVLKTIKAQLKAEIPHTDRKAHYGVKFYIKQPRCFSWNKVQYKPSRATATN